VLARQYGNAMRQPEGHYPNGPEYSQRDGYERQVGYERYGRSEASSKGASGGFYFLGHMSCFGAGSDPASDRAFVPNTRPAECKELCLQSLDCTAVMVGHGHCWMRRNLVRDSCKSNGQMQLFNAINPLKK